MGDTPAFRCDKYGNAVAAYPDRTAHGNLIGINVSGNAVYATDDATRLAILATDGTLRTPPHERGVAAKFPLDEVGLTPGEYILYTADEAGLWRALSEHGSQAVRGRQSDPTNVVADGPVEYAVDTLLEQVSDPDGGPANEAGGNLRRVAMDRPTQVVDRVESLFDLLDAHRAAVTLSDDADWTQVAVTAEVSFAVARATHEDPSATEPHLDALLELLGSDRTPAGDRPPLLHLTDALDVLGRADTDGVATDLARAIDDPESAETALNALYRLEHFYSTEDHPLCPVPSLRETVAAATQEPGPIGRAATEVETIHGFHRDPTD